MTRVLNTSTSSRPSRTTRRSVAALGAPVLALCLAVTGCSAGSEDSATASDTSAGAQSEARPEPAQGSSDGAPGDEAGSTGDGEAAPMESSTGGSTDVSTVVSAAGTAVVRTAQLQVQVEDVPAAVVRLRTAATTAGGSIADEVTTVPPPPAPADDTTDTDDPDRALLGGEGGTSTVMIRVPADRTEAFVAGLDDIGRVVQRSSSSEDVTEVVVDLDSRLASQRRSVERVRELLDRAGDLADVVTVEAELARRESELESLQARRSALADQVAQSTVTVTLVTAPDAGTEPEDSVVAGLTAGLSGGWDALTASARILITVLGAVTPFALVLGVAAVPVLMWRRRLRARPSAAPATSS